MSGARAAVSLAVTTSESMKNAATTIAGTMPPSTRTARTPPRSVSERARSRGLSAAPSATTTATNTSPAIVNVRTTNGVTAPAAPPAPLMRSPPRERRGATPGRCRRGRARRQGPPRARENAAVRRPRRARRARSRERRGQRAPRRRPPPVCRAARRRASRRRARRAGTPRGAGTSTPPAERRSRTQGARRARSSGDLRREIEDREDDDPDRSDEVPVEGDVLHREMALSVEADAPRANEQDRAEKERDDHVEPVERGDGEERRAVGVRLRRERLPRELDRLEHDEARAQGHRDADPDREAAHVASADPRLGPGDGRAAREEDDRADERDGELRSLAAGRRPRTVPREAEIAVAREKQREDRRVRRDDERHAPPARRAADRKLARTRPRPNVRARRLGRRPEPARHEGEQEREAERDEDEETKEDRAEQRKERRGGERGPDGVSRHAQEELRPRLQSRRCGGLPPRRRERRRLARVRDLRPPQGIARGDRRQAREVERLGRGRGRPLERVRRPGGAARETTAPEAAKDDEDDEAAGETDGRGPDRPSRPDRDDPRDDLHPRRDRDEHARGAEDAERLRRDADGEHVVHPDTEADDDRRDARDREGRVADDRSPREDRHDRGDHADRGHEDDVDVRVAEDPEEVLPEQRTPARGRIEKARPGHAVELEERGRDGERGDREEHRDRRDEDVPHEERHAIDRHAGRAELGDRDDEIDRAGRRRDPEEDQAERPEVHPRLRRVARPRERGVGEPAVLRDR